MNAWDELVARCAQRRREKIGPLSDQAFEELLLAVRERPADFVDSPSEQALLELARALDAYRASRQDDDLLDDDAFRAARERRLLALASACDRAVAIDKGCLDARLVALLAREEDPDALLGSLVELEREASVPVPEGGGDAWDDVWCRPRLRLRAAIARTCLDGARHRMARTAAASLLATSPRDELGARHTEMLACARLEDEAGLGELDARFAGHESAWSHLARVILLYKLNRMAAARRALRGFDGLCAGGAYALLRPTFVDVYLPDRPEVAPCSFEECLMAVREAEPIVADTPELIAWCQDQDWFVASARSFAERRDLDW
ncbi:MAG TPA: hypothetical protein IAA19_06725 [Candidatus Olsenella pullistercoris]|uniref:Uncharacterized protein n=1 Tax=Candidatus Olsenella pullistercoris TaxID=2838712 RepID=A0A9D2EZF5_9ACTN|nr:hypothetical protein [Candidatus Olsenella pullistercoris]